MFSNGFGQVIVFKKNFLEGYMGEGLRGEVTEALKGAS